MSSEGQQFSGRDGLEKPANGVNFALSKSARIFGGGVAGRILLASSAMLLGIVLLASTVAYYIQWNAHQRHYEDLVKSSAETIARSGNLSDLTHIQLENRVDSNRRSFDLDVLLITPLNDLEVGQLSGDQAERDSQRQRDADSEDTTDFDARADVGEINSAPGLTEPAGVGKSVLPDLSAQQFEQIQRGEGLMVFRNSDGDGILYYIQPISPTPEGFERTIVISGVKESTVHQEFRLQGATIIGTGAGIVLMGSGAVWVTSRGLRKATGDYGSEDLQHLIAYYRSVLHSVSDGLLLLDSKHGVVLYNAEAAKLLDIPPDAGDEPFPVTELNIPTQLQELIMSGRVVDDEVHYTDTHVLLINQQPALGETKHTTWVTTLRDHTELRKLTGELISARSFSDSLRSQTHEFANRMHLVASLIEMGETKNALDFATRAMSGMDRPSEDIFTGFDQPILAALIFTKMTQARENDIELTVDTHELSDPLPGDEGDLVSVLGNLLDNAFEAVSRVDLDPHRRRVNLVLRGANSEGFTITVTDDGPGISESQINNVFERGWSTKHDGVEADTGTGKMVEASARGVGMSIVTQAVKRLGGAIDADGGTGDEAEPGTLRGAEFSVWLPPHVVR